jgi:hypothetical protein
MEKWELAPTHILLEEGVDQCGFIDIQSTDQRHFGDVWINSNFTY